MDTLEAIAWVRLLTACLNSPAGCEIKEHKESLENCEKADEIVNRLQQGEAYKQIVEEINEMLRVDIANNTYDYNALDCAEGYLHQIKLIKQNHFPNIVINT